MEEAARVSVKEKVHYSTKKKLRHLDSFGRIMHGSDTSNMWAKQSYKIKYSIYFSGTNALNCFARLFFFYVISILWRLVV